MLNYLVIIFVSTFLLVNGLIVMLTFGYIVCITFFVIFGDVSGIIFSMALFVIFRIMLFNQGNWRWSWEPPLGTPVLSDCRLS